ncbi:MAG: hypothetical protein WCH13_18505, partial [Deltaproteobacteria bacterium]
MGQFSQIDRHRKSRQVNIREANQFTICASNGIQNDVCTEKGGIAPNVHAFPLKFALSKGNIKNP